MKSSTVFVVEDNLVYQSLIVRALEPISDCIFSYTTGENCLEEMHKEPTVVIMDYELAGSMNGLDTIKRIKNIKPSTRVILFSTQKGLDTAENLCQYGSFEYLEKNYYSFPLLTELVSPFSR